MSGLSLSSGDHEELQFLIKDDSSDPRYSGRIIPVLTSNEVFDSWDRDLLRTLDLKIDHAGFVSIGKRAGYELGFLVVPDNVNTLRVQANSRAQFVCVVRYIFRGDYTFTDPSNKNRDAQFDHDIFRSIRFHVDMAILAEKYQMPSLVKQAQEKVNRELEAACSLPFPPGDLIDTIPYIYKKLVDNDGFIKDIVTFCVANYHPQQLDQREDFQRLLRENENFNFRLRKTATENRVQTGALTEPLDIPPSNAMVESRRRERQMSLDAEDFWENSDEAAHSSDDDDDEEEEEEEEEELADIEKLHISGEEAELLEALIVSAPDSLENSVESLPKSPEQAETPAPPKHIEYERRMKVVELDWEVIGDS